MTDGSVGAVQLRAAAVIMRGEKLLLVRKEGETRWSLPVYGVPFGQRKMEALYGGFAMGFKQALAITPWEPRWSYESVNQARGTHEDITYFRATVADTAVLQAPGYEVCWVDADEARSLYKSVGIFAWTAEIVQRMLHWRVL